MKLEVNIQKKLKEFDLDVQFQMEKGILGILGPSGCGKSMTCKSIAGIVDLDKGKILVNEKDLTHLKPQKRNVGYLFQNYALFPNMNVEENIRIALKDQNKLSDLIYKFHLEGLEKRYPRQLSGGQQQRVALARILAQDPEIILLDEPFSALDSHLKEKLRLELSTLLTEFEGIVILVTHDRDEAFQLCDKILLMEKGRVLTMKDTHELFEQPEYVQAARLTGCKNISKIERIDQNHIKAVEWNLLFEVDPIDDSITHIGIRAHDFIPAQKEDVNAFEVGNVRIHELPFEWEILLENGLWWKVHKEIHEHEFQLPSYIKVNKDNIIYLK